MVHRATAPPHQHRHLSVIPQREMPRMLTPRNVPPWMAFTDNQILAMPPQLIPEMSRQVRQRHAFLISRNRTVLRILIAKQVPMPPDFSIPEARSVSR